MYMSKKVMHISSSKSTNLTWRFKCVYWSYIFIIIMCRDTWWNISISCSMTNIRFSDMPGINYNRDKMIIKSGSYERFHSIVVRFVKGYGRINIWIIKFYIYTINSLLTCQSMIVRLTEEFHDAFPNWIHS